MDNQNSFFRNKKTVVSFVLSLFVFYIHFRVFSAFKHADGTTEYIFDRLLILTKVAVPLFFIISGALFYRNFQWKLTVQKWKSRFFSLCIPYLIWNTFWLLLALLGNYTPLGTVLGGVKASFSLGNILSGIFLYGYFEPFWFIFQLIVLTALCPVIYLLLKNKWIGLIGIFGFYIAICFGFQLDPKIFPNTDMVLYYFIGAWIGIHNFSAFTARRNKIYAVTGLIIYLLCCVIHSCETLLPEWFDAFQMPLLVNIVSCGAFWIAFDYFEMKRCPRYMTDSFLIYALHSFVGAAISKILSLIMPSDQTYLLLTAFIAFSSTIAVICITGRLLGKYLPHLKQLLTGR